MSTRLPHATRPALFTLRLLAAVLCVAMQGCGERDEVRAGGGRVRVVYWEKWTGFEGEAMQQIVDDFNASQDRVFVERVTVSQIDQKVMLATVGGNPPDVAGLWSQAIPNYAEKSALLPLDGYLRRAGITHGEFLPIFWDACVHKGFVWALPTMPAGNALHWNKRMFREAGLDPDQPPRTIEELDAVAERLTIVEVERDGRPRRVRFTELTDEERSGHRFTLVQLGYSPTEPGWWTPQWGYFFGGRLDDGDGRITAADERNVRAYEWYASYPAKYGLANLRRFASSFGNFASPQNAFMAEQIAMVQQGVWMHNFIQMYSPGLEWAAAPFPTEGVDLSTPVTICDCDLLAIPAGARHPDEAFEFIRYVTRQGVIEKLALLQRKYSPRTAVSPGFVESHPNPYISVFIDLAHSPRATGMPRLTMWMEYRDEMLVAADRAFAGVTSPREALRAVEQRMQWKLDRVLRRWDAVKDHRIGHWREQVGTD